MTDSLKERRSEGDISKKKKKKKVTNLTLKWCSSFVNCSARVWRVGGAMTNTVVPLARIVPPTGECQFQCGLRY